MVHELQMSIEDNAIARSVERQSRQYKLAAMTCGVCNRNSRQIGRAGCLSVATICSIWDLSIRNLACNYDSGRPPNSGKPPNRVERLGNRLPV